MSGKPKRAPVDSLEELRAATREAHEALKGLKEMHREIAEERRLLEAARTALLTKITQLVQTASDDLKAAYDTRLRAMAKEVSDMIRDTEQIIQERFNKMLLGFLMVGEEDRDAGRIPMELMMASWYQSLNPRQQIALQARAVQFMEAHGNTEHITTLLSQIPGVVDLAQSGAFRRAAEG